MKKAVAFTIFDDNNAKFLPAFENSLRHFHKEDELPLVKIDQKELSKWGDPEKFYKATPYYALPLLKDYELVIKLDVDQIITYPLTHIIEDKSYDVGTVLNSNPREFKKWMVQVWDVLPANYMNCGFVAMRSSEFVAHWMMLCNKPNIKNYAYREQDILNILYYYGNYNMKCFDYSDKFHGLASNSYWPEIELRDDKLVLPQTKDNTGTWPPDREKIIVSLHFAEGQMNIAQKGNYRTKVKEDVALWLDKLIKG